MKTELVLTFVNLLLCVAWGWGAMCRLHRMHARVLLHAQVLHLGLFVLSVPCGLQYYFFGTFAGWPDILASLALCAFMWATAGHWREGVPRHLTRGSHDVPSHS